MQTTLAAPFIADNDTNDILICTSQNGVAWTKNSQVGQSSKNSPSMVLFNFQFWLAFISNSGANDLLICSSPDGVKWTGSTKVGQSSKNSPSLILFNNGLWLAFVANNATNDLLICSSPDGTHWSDDTQVGQSSTQAPSLAVFNKKLWMAFVANNSTNDLLICSSADGRNWSKNTQVGQSTKSTPSLAVFNNKLWLAFVANNDTNDVLVCSSADGVTWTNNTRVGQSSKTAPSLAVFDKKLILSFVANNNTDQILVCSSTDGLSWSSNIQMGAGVQIQSSSHAPSLTPAVLVTGALFPPYQILTLVYAPPGTKGGSSKSNVNYTNTTTSGTVNTISSSFKQGVQLSATLGSGGDDSSGGDDIVSHAGATASFSFSLTETDSSAIAVTQTTSFSNQIFGGDTDGINHGNDEFFLWTNPQLNFAIDPTGNVQWSMSINGTIQAPSVFVSELQNPSTMRPDVKAALTAAGLTATDFAQILATDPFASANAAIDPDRYLLCTQSFNYEPPLPQAGPSQQVLNMTDSVTDTTIHTFKQSYTVGLKSSAEEFGLTLADSDQLTYTIENSLETTSTNTAAAVATIAQPSAGYNGPIDLLVYWDTVYHTFMFAFPSVPLIASGTILDILGQAVANTLVTLTVGSLTLSTFTGPSGDYRFYGASAGQGTVTVSGQKFPVTVGTPATKQVLRMTSQKTAPVKAA
jgi:putative hemolysin